MNQRMWRHPRVVANVERLVADGVDDRRRPARGYLAEGDVGPGRMVEPAEILAAIAAALWAERRVGRSAAEAARRPRSSLRSARPRRDGPGVDSRPNARPLDRPSSSPGLAGALLAVGSSRASAAAVADARPPAPDGHRGDRAAASTRRSTGPRPTASRTSWRRTPARPGATTWAAAPAHRATGTATPGWRRLVPQPDALRRRASHGLRRLLAGPAHVRRPRVQCDVQPSRRRDLR